MENECSDLLLKDLQHHTAIIFFGEILPVEDVLGDRVRSISCVLLHRRNLTVIEEHFPQIRQLNMFRQLSSADMGTQVTSGFVDQSA